MESFFSRQPRIVLWDGSLQVLPRVPQEKDVSALDAVGLCTLLNTFDIFLAAEILGPLLVDVRNSNCKKRKS